MDANDRDTPADDYEPEERFDGLDSVFKQILILVGLILLAIAVVIVYAIVRA